MTFYEAAVEVLRSVERPLHYKKITELAIKQNLLSHVGKTPELTMGTRLTQEIRKDDGSALVVRTRPGVFALRAWEGDGAPDFIRETVNLEPEGAQPSQDSDTETSSEEPPDAATQRRRFRRRRRRQFLADSESDAAATDVEPSEAEPASEPEAEPSEPENLHVEVSAAAQTVDVQASNDSVLPAMSTEREAELRALTAALHTDAVTAITHHLETLNEETLGRLVGMLLERMGYVQTSLLHNEGHSSFWSARTRPDPVEITALVVLRHAPEDIVGVEDINVIRQKIVEHGAHRAMLFALGGASPSAYQASLLPGQIPVLLFNKTSWARKLVEHDLGSQTHKVSIALADSSFFQNLTGSSA